MAPTKKPNDDEFSPHALAMIKEAEILGPVHSVKFAYNDLTIIEQLEEDFQTARREDPLLETTPLEPWIAWRILPHVNAIRSNIDIEEGLLVEALTKYLRENVEQKLLPFQYENEQVLNTSIEAYAKALETLFFELRDRRKSLRKILGLRRGAYNIRQVLAPTKATPRETLILKGIKHKWPNRKIAMELDKTGKHPKNNRDFKSYQDMLYKESGLFRSMKHSVLEKFSSRSGSKRSLPTAPVK